MQGQLGLLPDAGVDEPGEIPDVVRILYVGMTPATENLRLSSSRPSPLAEKLEAMAEKHGAAARA